MSKSGGRFNFSPVRVPLAPSCRSSSLRQDRYAITLGCVKRLGTVAINGLLLGAKLRAPTGSGMSGRARQGDAVLIAWRSR
jgi:hypothetical protein